MAHGSRDDRCKAGYALPIRALHRGAPDEAAMHRVWYHGPGFWLERSAKPDAANDVPILLR